VQTLIKNKNSMLVLGTCLNSCPKSTKFILNEVPKNVNFTKNPLMIKVEIILTKEGTILFKHFLENCFSDKSFGLVRYIHLIFTFIEPMLEWFKVNFEECCKSSSASFRMLEILKYGPRNIQAALFEYIGKNFVSLSKDKYGR